jgi:hypothetical protein
MQHNVTMQRAHAQLEALMLMGGGIVLLTKLLNSGNTQKHEYSTSISRKQHESRAMFGALVQKCSIFYYHSTCKERVAYFTPTVPKKSTSGQNTLSNFNATLFS